MQYCGNDVFKRRINNHALWGIKMANKKILFEYGKNMHELIGKRVFIYWNLHKNVWSIKCKKTGLVLGHTKCVYLKDCKYKVSESGRQRVLKEKRKNVHAGVEGYISYNEFRFSKEHGAMTYNPYKYDSFIDRDSKQPLFTSDTAYMGSCEVNNINRPFTLYGNGDNRQYYIRMRG